MNEVKWYYANSGYEVPDEVIQDMTPNFYIHEKEGPKTWTEAIEQSDIGLFLMDREGNIMGNEDDSKWKNAKWYQKLVAIFSKRYKNKFFNIKPMNLITRS